MSGLAVDPFEGALDGVSKTAADLSKMRVFVDQMPDGVEPKEVAVDSPFEPNGEISADFQLRGPRNRHVSFCYGQSR